MRLAQSIFLQDSESRLDIRPMDRQMRSKLWKTVLQHGSIFSLCFELTTKLATDKFSFSGISRSLELLINDVEQNETSL